VPNDIVLASGPNSGLTVGFGSIDPRRVVDASGFENTNPFAIIAGPQDPNGASADIGINLAIDYGTLTAGSTISVPWYIVFGASQAAALMNLACGNGMLDPGEACDDGNLVPGDGCEATCTPTGCGDGSVAGAEECDDGNIGSGDCCSSGCLFEASGSSCPDEDGNECTVNAQCDGAGACLQEPASGGTACTVDSNVCTLDQCDAGTCGHPPTPPGGSCPDDGNACTLDQCDGAGVCGHPPAPSGSSCPDTDGNACTVNPHCNGAGTCLQDPAAADTACQDEGNLCTRDRCDSGGVCLHLGVPQTPCRGPFVPRRGSVLLRADAITWRWVRGEATAFSAFGNPFSSTDYAFCVYDASAAPQPLMSARAPAGGVCTLGNPCWTQKGAERIDYNDALAADPDGITQIRLKSGIDGKASVLLRGKDPNLGFATPPLVPPVVVQLHAANGECWGATYSAPRVNDVSRFKSAPD